MPKAISWPFYIKLLVHVTAEGYFVAFLYKIISASVAFLYKNISASVAFLFTPHPSFNSIYKSFRRKATQKY